MKRISRSRKLAVALAMGANLGALGFAKAAHAQEVLTWVPLGANGASAIAVGPNDIPWILGCGGGFCNDTGYEQAVFFLRWLPCSYQPCLVGPSPQWVYAQGGGMTLAVDLNGLPHVAGTNGVIYGMGTQIDSNGTVVPAIGNWFAQEGAVSAFAAGVMQHYYGNAGEMFYPRQYGNAPEDAVYEQQYLWGFGCGSACAQGPFSTDAGIYFGSWSETVQDSDGDSDPAVWSGWTHLSGGAMRIALFSEPPSGSTLANGSNTHQSPWVLNAEGQIYAMGTDGGWHQINRPFNLPVQSITDHYVLTNSGGVWVWTGDSFGDNPNPTAMTNGWNLVISGSNTTTASPLVLKQIAWSQAVSGGFVGQSAQIGPSELWAIDWSGAVYRAEWLPTSSPPPK
jgi:hypothetical protein